MPRLSAYDMLDGRAIRAQCLQIAVLANHQNGKDTHVRQVKIFSPTQFVTTRRLDYELRRMDYAMHHVAGHSAVEVCDIARLMDDPVWATMPFQMHATLR
jgi:hypothetical protein